MGSLHQLMDWISAAAGSLVDQWGAWGIFFGMLLESACIPLPSEVIMLTGGFFAAEGKLNLEMVILAGVIGNIAGSVLIYWIGSAGARVLLDKYGKYVFIHTKHIRKAEAWFARYGEKAAFFGRILPVIRTFISLPAGIAKMNFTRFLLYTAIGCLIWDLALGYLGYQLHDNWKVIETYMHPITYVVAAIVVVYLGYLVNKIRLDSKKNPPQST